MTSTMNAKRTRRAATTRVWLLAVALSGLETADAGQYAAPDGSFTITLPQDPSADVNATSATYRSADGDVTYLIKRTPVPAAFLGDKTPDLFYEKYQSASVAGATAGVLQSSRKLLSKGKVYAGQEFVFQAETKASGKPYEMQVRVFRVGNDVYAVTATMPRVDQARARAAAVLDTFTFLK